MCPWSALGSSGWTCQNHLPRLGGKLAKPYHRWLRSTRRGQQLCLELHLDVWVPQHIAKAESSHPMKNTRTPLNLPSSPLGHYSLLTMDWLVKWEPWVWAQFSPHLCSDPSIKLPIHSSLIWTHPHVVVTPLGSGVGTHPFLVKCQCVWASSPFWRFKDERFLGYHTNVNCCGLYCFTILLCFLTSVPDGGCAGPQHVSRPRDTRPRKKKRLRFQVNAIINLFIMKSDLSIPFILLRNRFLVVCHMPHSEDLNACQIHFCCFIQKNL